MVVVDFWVQPVPKVRHLETEEGFLGINCSIFDWNIQSEKALYWDPNLGPRISRIEPDTKWEIHLGIDLRPPPTSGAPRDDPRENTHAFTTDKRTSCVSLVTDCISFRVDCRSGYSLYSLFFLYSTQQKPTPSLPAQISLSWLKKFLSWQWLDDWILLEEDPVTPWTGFWRLDWNSHLSQMIFSLKNISFKTDLRNHHFHRSTCPPSLVPPQPIITHSSPSYTSSPAWCW